VFLLFGRKVYDHRYDRPQAVEDFTRCAESPARPKAKAVATATEGGNRQ
jgi:hypothetical protein